MHHILKKGESIMNFLKRKHLESDTECRKVVEAATDYWIDAIKNADKNQISYEMGDGVISLTDNNLEVIRFNLSNFIYKLYPTKGDYIMLWTSNGEYFERVGVDPILKSSMLKSKISVTALPSNLTMWIYSDEIEVEKDFQHFSIYKKEKQR